MRKIMLVALSILMILIIGGCGKTNTSAEKKVNTDPKTEGTKQVETKQVETKQVETLKLGVMKGAQSFPISVIQTKGLDKKYGLKLEVKPLAESGAIHTAIMGHQVDAVFSTWQAYAVQRTRGEDEVVIAPMNNYVSYVHVKKDSKINSMKDLRGKKIGTAYPPSNGTVIIFKYAVQKEFGFDPFKENNVIQGAAPLLLGLLEKGEIDAVYLGEPQATSSLTGGKNKSIWNVSEAYKNIGERIPMQVSVVTTETSLKKSSEALKNFVKAYTEAKDILIKDNSLWPELAKNVGIDTEEGAKILRESLQPNYIQEWNEDMIKKEIEFSYKIVDAFKEKDFLPEKMPEGLFSFEIYKK
ncbi:MAG: ABC transporter substrate-binding protein [Thermincola sp.]|jgi:NitT/TauT family transport system substrate-binding protein|nr:ABC transporter substrate-binding protein [Thermincola sp.]MDT3701434.1 ABC transporter substrate-binding protein [Thermincola sp.]